MMLLLCHCHRAQSSESPPCAPQNHWFGPAGDPRAAGIGTPDAIRLVWSCHREIVKDWGPIPQDVQLVQS